MEQRERESIEQKILKSLLSTKMEFEDYIIETINKIESGEGDVLTGYARLKVILDTLSQSIKQIEGMAIQEAEKYISASHKDFQYAGISFTIRRGGQRYNYSSIDEYKETNDRLSEIKEKYKAAYKAWEKGIIPIDDDGVEMQLPQIIPIKDSLIVKL